MDVVLFFDTLGMALLQVKVREWGKSFGRVNQLTFKSRMRSYCKILTSFKNKNLSCFKKRGKAIKPLLF